MVKRCIWFFSVVALLTSSCGLSRRTASKPAMAASDDGRALTLVSSTGRPILTYNYTETPAPAGVRKVFARSGYIHPLCTPSGFVLTRIQPRDHWHHYGFWNPWTRVEYDGRVYDLWNLGDSLGTGRSRHVDALTVGDEACGFEATLDHVAFTPGGETVILGEKWKIRATETPDGYLLDFVSVLTPATDKPVTIKAYRYQGFSIRATEAWTRDNCEMMTSEGLERPQIDGSRARWVYVNGATGPETTGGFLFLSSPDNYNAPEPLRIWDQNANRGRGDVYVNFCPTKTQDWRLVPGQTYELRYRVLTYDGSLDPERAERLWQDYVSSGAARHQ